MSEVKKTTKENKLEFNTYCFFTEEEKDVSQTIGLIFKDYIESLKIRKSCVSESKAFDAQMPRANARANKGRLTFLFWKVSLSFIIKAK